VCDGQRIVGGRDQIAPSVLCCLLHEAGDRLLGIAVGLLDRQPQQHLGRAGIGRRQRLLHRAGGSQRAERDQVPLAAEQPLARGNIREQERIDDVGRVHDVAQHLELGRVAVALDLASARRVLGDARRAHLAQLHLVAEQPNVTTRIDAIGTIFRDWDTDTVRDALNAHLRPHPIAILSAERVADDFNARTSAIRRRYLYRIVNRRADLTLDAGRAWRVPRPLDTDAMHKAAQLLIGKHDFTTFRSTECQAKSPVKTLDILAVQRDGDEVQVTAVARSFLHNQVRSMVGSLVCVGEGKWAPKDLREALDARDRTACGPVAPPDGLYLMQVDY